MNKTTRWISIALLALTGCVTIPRQITDIASEVGLYTRFDDYQWPEKTWVVGYGPVNGWMHESPAEIAAIAEAGVGIAHIEYFGWAQDGFLANPTKLDKPYRAMLAECRKRRVILFVSIANDNKGQGKYGDDRKPLSAYDGALEHALQTILKEGKEGVIIQPVGETQTSTGRAYEQRCLAVLGPKGFRLAWNNGSRPASHPGGFQYHAYHPGSTSVKVPPPALNVTDHSGILRQLCEGGDITKPFRVDATVAYVQEQKARGVDVILYEFGTRKVNGPLMKALKGVTK